MKLYYRNLYKNFLRTLFLYNKKNKIFFSIVVIFFIIQIFDSLLFHCIDINEKDYYGYTSFNTFFNTSYKAILTSYDFLHYLILKSANINIKSDDVIIPINNIVNTEIKTKVVKFIL